jgi:DNA end-binding protein Ku
MARPAAPDSLSQPYGGRSGLFIGRFLSFALHSARDGKCQSTLWSGQIRISLVAFNISLITATKHSSQLPPHELQRKTEERIHHRNVLEDGTPFDDNEIIKGYEYAKGAYVLHKPGDLDDIKLPSSDELELNHFVDVEGLPVIRLERPYFVTPNGKKDVEIYQVLAEALRSNGSKRGGSCDRHYA